MSSRHQYALGLSVIFIVGGICLTWVGSLFWGGVLLVAAILVGLAGFSDEIGVRKST